MLGIFPPYFFVFPTHTGIHLKFFVAGAFPRNYLLVEGLSSRIRIVSSPECCFSQRRLCFQVKRPP